MPVFYNTVAFGPKSLPKKDLLWSHLLEKLQFPTLISVKEKYKKNISCQVDAVTLQDWTPLYTIQIL